MTAVGTRETLGGREAPAKLPEGETPLQVRQCLAQGLKDAGPFHPDIMASTQLVEARCPVLCPQP
jgi:hypothetical protein